MSYYWALVEHVDNQKLKALSNKNMDEQFGLFHDSGLAGSLNQACEDWQSLLLAIMEINVEPNRLDLQAALTRAQYLLAQQACFFLV